MELLAQTKGEEFQEAALRLFHVAAEHLHLDSGIRFANNVYVIPDILANAGGVTVSYFEWVQNLEMLHWSEDDVNRRLREIMTRSFQEVREIAAKERVDMRTAAYILAVGRVAEATLLRGVYP